MKLVEIKDVRPGQIRKVTAFNQWKDEEEFEVLAVIEASGLGEYAEFDIYAEFYDIKTKQLMEDDSEELRFYENGELIGKLDITHRIENNRLIKIPRKEVNEDDIVCFDDETNRLAVVLKVSPITITPTLFDGDKLEISRKVSIIGVLGVTHEFVNDREA